MIGWFRKKEPATSRVPRVGRNLRQYTAVQSLARYGDMVSSSGSADYELHIALPQLRQKARYLARNSGTMKRYRQLIVDNVIGPNGFVFQCRTRRAGSDDLDKSLNNRVEAEWASFWKRPTVDGFMTGQELLKMAVLSWTTDGEVIWEIVPRPDAPSMFKINPIEADMLDESLTTINKATGNQIRMGVEVDGSGRHVAYWFLIDHPGDLTVTGGMVGRDRHRRIDAQFVIHAYEVLRPGQTRGEPPSASAINPIKMMDGYREAEVMGRRLRAAVMGFFKSMLPKTQGIETLSDGVGTDRGDDEMLEMNITPGTLKELPAGLEFQEFSPGGWQSDFAEADGQFKKEASMGLGISNFSLGMETSGVSYSTGRTVAIEDRDHYRVLQQFFLSRLMHPLFEAWVTYNSLSATTQIPPTRIAAVRDKYVFRPRGWDWVDPAKDVRANREALESGQTSLTRIAAQRGIELSDLVEEIADEIEMLKKLNIGVVHPFVVASVSGLPQDVAPDTTDGEDDSEDEDAVA